VSWILASMAILGAALVAGFAWYERRHPTSRVLALVATLAALAALGRIAFAPLPNVKPTTDIVLISGYVLGGAPGFAVGAVAALTSNLFFGQGPWTPWQMVAWGLVGVLGAALARAAGRNLGRVPLAVACGAAGALYGAIMNISLWVTYSGGHSWGALAAYFGTSLWFDVAHVAGNVVFCLALGPVLVKALARYRTRFEVRWVPVAAAVAAAAVVAAAAIPQPAVASTRSSVRYVLRAQNRDGGWGAGPGRRSDPLYSGWAALGVAAAGHHPRSALRYVQRHMRSDVGALERGILVLRAYGAGARGAARRLASRRHRDGSFDGQVNHTAFAVLALRAAGRSRRDRAVRGAVKFLGRQANRDGGFNPFGRGGPSDVDDTSAVIQALVSAGRRGGPTVRHALRFLARHQNRDGGFPLQPGQGSNAQSTAWAVQALVAARHGVRRPLAYLRGLTQRSGAVRYSRTSTQTPVWVTGEALMALARRPLPL
jgi:energy-coupling factor transport system substrate-specific component